MKRSEFDKLWFTGNVKIHVDEKKALLAVWKGWVGKKYLRSQILLSIICLVGMSIGVFIMARFKDFRLSPTEIGTSWWGAVIFILATGNILIMKGKAAQAVKNRVIRDPEFFVTAQQKELIELEEY